MIDNRFGKRQNMIQLNGLILNYTGKNLRG